MALFDWDDKYSINVKSMDEQHLKIVELINDLYRALLSSKPRDVMGNILERMIDYAVTHFQDEEELMKQQGFPWLNSHRVEHEAFVEKVLDYQKQFGLGTLVLSTEIVNYLKDWLAGHIMGEDKSYGVFCNEKGIY
jgi:hemerythrin